MDPLAVTKPPSKRTASLSCRFRMWLGVDATARQTAAANQFARFPVVEGDDSRARSERAWKDERREHSVRAPGRAMTSGDVLQSRLGLEK